MDLDESLLNLVNCLFEILKKQNATISSCESLTGGMFGSVLCSISGASNFYKGGYITYTNEVKESIGVKKETLDKFTAISKECAIEMAENTRRNLNTDYAISFTGNAGPLAQDGKDVGEVWIGISSKEGTNAIRYLLEGDRNKIRIDSVKQGLKMLLMNL